MKNILILMSIIFLMSGCYENDTVFSELQENTFDPKPSELPLENEVYKFFESSNSKLIIRYNPLDYQWNWSKNSNVYKQVKDFNFLTPNDISILSDTLTSENNLDKLSISKEDNQTLLKGVILINEIFGNTYKKDFKMKNFPPKIFLADSVNIKNMSGGKDLLDKLVYFGNNHIVIGKIRKDYLDNLTNEEKLKHKAFINAVFWGNYMYNNNKLNIPESFFNVCKGRYDGSLKYAKLFPEFKNKDFEDMDLKTIGFWSDNKDKRDKYYWNSPTKDVDVFQFIYNITSKTTAEMNVILKKYPLLKEKYIILIEYIKKEYNLDLQSIGDKK